MNHLRNAKLNEKEYIYTHTYICIYISHKSRWVIAFEFNIRCRWQWESKLPQVIEQKKQRYILVDIIFVTLMKIVCFVFYLFIFCFIERMCSKFIIIQVHYWLNSFKHILHIFSYLLIPVVFQVKSLILTACRTRQEK